MHEFAKILENLAVIDEQLQGSLIMTSIFDNGLVSTQLQSNNLTCFDQLQATRLG